MNRKRLADLADIIENDRLPNVVFDMSTVAERRRDINQKCGTAACIAGYALCAAYGNRKARELDCATARAAHILGLTDKQSNDLFFPDGWYLGKTKAEAVRVLRHAAKTGRIAW